MAMNDGDTNNLLSFKCWIKQFENTSFVKVKKHLAPRCQTMEHFAGNLAHSYRLIDMLPHTLHLVAVQMENCFHENLFANKF